jgi:hypothetical protein
MKLTIIPSDVAVYVDGVMKAYAPLPLNLTQCGIPSDVHALQWKDTKGWIEFTDNDDGTKPQNEAITELPSWANAYVTKWDEAKAAEEAAIEAAKQATQNQPATQGTQTL